MSCRSAVPQMQGPSIVQVRQAQVAAYRQLAQELLDLDIRNQLFRLQLCVEAGTIDETVLYTLEEKVQRALAAIEMKRPSLLR
mmetsp:Transcript_63642/g.151825  ORF Transcript_63642/g.151825 Transcript_63642/m.151825 type:complete len:83 (-) Transcript_63642:128-376(-)